MKSRLDQYLEMANKLSPGSKEWDKEMKKLKVGGAGLEVKKSMKSSLSKKLTDAGIPNTYYTTSSTSYTDFFVPMKFKDEANKIAKEMDALWERKK
jgi:hypothetical protein